MVVEGLSDETFFLRKKIQQIRSELNDLDKPVQELPELISSTNLLRINDHLTESNAKKDELLSAYDQYVNSLEAMLAAIFEIQKELTSILKDQSSMISGTKHTKSSKSKKSKK